MAKLYSAEDMAAINLFAAAVMQPVGAHDAEAVLAERINRAFRVARVMLATSKEVAGISAPVVKRTKKDVE